MNTPQLKNSNSDGASGDGGLQPENTVERRRETRVFLFLTVVLAPLLAIGLVGGYGLAIWIFQVFAGPPGS